MRNKEEKIDQLMLHYNRGRQDMDTRRTRRNGWNETINAYMGKLPTNWPFLSVVTDPRIRTSILEKTSRLLNAKLQGRLVPRENGDVIKARINNALLDFQWDFANEGGSMLEKTAFTDQIARIYGGAFVLVFWDNKKNSNEIKLLDPRDVFFDGAATHIRNARWVQVREWTTWDKLEARGYKVAKLKRQVESGEVTSQLQSSAYESQVKANRGLQNRVGETDEKQFTIVEVVTEWTADSCTIFLPRLGEVLSEGPNPYKHGKIPIAMLRYYPLGDDIYGESEVEAVIPLQRAINAILCGFIDEMNFSMRPPLKISSNGVRMETIEFGPGAQWVMQSPGLVEELQMGGQVIQNFNAAYPALVAAYNTAMGDSSLGVSNVRGQFDSKTATEVRDLAQQQNNRDQYNQLFLGEFLKDIMMMWLSNNKQYLLDDPTKKYYILKILGKDNIKYFQQMKLDDSDIPDYAMKQISDTIAMNPNAVSDNELTELMSDVAVPKNPIVLNPEEKDPEKFQVKKKLNISPNDEEAELYITAEDFDGDFDYIPDVTSMASGASKSLKDARQNAIQTAILPPVSQGLAAQGFTVNWKELIIDAFQDGGVKDAEGLIIPIQQQNGPQPGGNVPPGFGSPQGGPILMGANPNGPVQPGPQAVPPQAGGGGLPPAQF